MPSSTTTPSLPPSLGSDDLTEVFEQGVKTFSILFTRWMDTNEWSHPVMVNLAKAAAGNVGWLHSSQISGLRHAKIKSPGPRTFIAIERLNFYLHRYLTSQKLIPNTSSSNFYNKGWAITENGAPPPVGWWVEVFCGVRVPKDIDLGQHRFTDKQALVFSESFGRLFRVLMAKKELDLIEDLPAVLRDLYPAGDEARMAKLFQVVKKESVWNGEEIAYELPALVGLVSSLGGPATEAELLETLDF